MKSKLSGMKPQYHINDLGEFVIENYNHSKPFADFFPGIAGKYGIPMWVFYVNRGQAISSFGIKDKDHAILEFFPANKAWQLTATHGFRTFIKSGPAAHQLFYEPFQNSFSNRAYTLKNRMRISPHDLTLEEENISLGLAVKVEYFNVPLDSYAGLCRIVTLRNTSRRAQMLSIVDGLPQIVPYGTNDFFLKKMSRTIEAWMNVENLDACAPFYKLTVDPSDRPEVVHISQGNFYIGFSVDGRAARRVKPIIDPASVFSSAGDFSCPHAFLAQKKFKRPAKEISVSKTPCAFVPLEFILKPGEEKSLYVLTGYARTVEALNSMLPRVTSPAYFARMKEENRRVIGEITADISTESSSRTFDLYARQTYLDNVLRGGYPVTFDCGTSFHLYSRKHGDLERDYNNFQIQPAYFSQGNGNYRDANQNRRSDVWFNPRLGDENIIHFFSLLQLDGFNPLIVKGAQFEVRDLNALRAGLPAFIPQGDIEKLAGFLAKPFTPGDFIFFLEDNGIRVTGSYDTVLDFLLAHSTKVFEAEHGEGFWSDHWTYNLDLIESYLGVYPEKERELFFGKRAFVFYDNIETVRPRQEKYVLYEGVPRQLHSCAVDSAKREMIHARASRPHTVRADYGRGDVYATTLINKLLCLAVNKAASLDPCGVGIEMEANKPNWFDALNGLPALFGSSLCETFELKRLLLMIKKAIAGNRVETVQVTQEIADFLNALNAVLKDHLGSSCDDRDFWYWDRSAALKEQFRETVKMGVSGREVDMSGAEIMDIVDNALRKVDSGIAKAKAGGKPMYYAYFRHEVSAFEQMGGQHIRPTAFIQKRLPFFLEAQMHALRLAGSNEEARALHTATKSSPLYDRKLKMYKVTASLLDQPEEIGRCRIFTPGWLENESIWLHMEYKYLLELLKQGLFSQYYEEFKNALVPFQNPRRYGRSILENSSFLVSSAFPDAKLHGNGFVARLSGSTAEFLQIWLLMNAGSKPFLLNERGELVLEFKPALAGWLFPAGTRAYSFRFLGRTEVFYYNRQRRDTFGPRGAAVSSISFTDAAGAPVTLQSPVIPAPYASQVRDGLISRIEVHLE